MFPESPLDRVIAVMDKVRIISNPKVTSFLSLQIEHQSMSAAKDNISAGSFGLY
jgi:hypothetical protein